MNRKKAYDDLISYSSIATAVGILSFTAGVIFLFDSELRDVGYLTIPIGILGIVIGFPFICHIVSNVREKIKNKN